MSYMGHLGGIPDLNSLLDISVINPLQNEVLSFNDTTKRWENKEFSAINVSIDALLDTVVTDPQNNQTLLFNTATGKWENKAVTNVDRPFQFFISSF